MTRHTPRTTGGACAVVLAAAYVLAGATYLALPADQKGGTILHEPARYLGSLAEGSTLLVANHLILGIGALLGIAVVIGVRDWARPLGAGWLPWVSTLGILGFSVTAVDNFQIAALDPARAADFARADPVARTAIAVTNSMVSIDPEMWLSFGLSGVWILGASWLVLRGRLLPPVHAVLGLLAATCYLLIEVGSVLDSPLLLLASAGVGGLVVGPIWYAWLGLALLRSDRAEEAPASSSPGLRVAASAGHVP